MEKILKFLGTLKINNNQTWFIDHMDEYEVAKLEVEEFAYSTLTQLSLIDTRLDAETDVEKFISNIMDIRPKKPIRYFDFLDVSISPLANDGNEPVYLIHIEPENSYISIKYDPDVFGLQVMRNYISRNASLFDSMLQDCYTSGFVLVESGMLPALPKGYTIGMPGESYIRLKQYEIRSPIDLLKGKDELFQDLLLTFEAALPLVQFLRKGLRL